MMKLKSWRISVLWKRHKGERRIASKTIIIVFARVNASEFQILIEKNK